MTTVATLSPESYSAQRDALNARIAATQREFDGACLAATADPAATTRVSLLRRTITDLERERADLEAAFRASRVDRAQATDQRDVERRKAALQAAREAIAAEAELAADIDAMVVALADKCAALTTASQRIQSVASRFVLHTDRRARDTFDMQWSLRPETVEAAIAFISKRLRHDQGARPINLSQMVSARSTARLEIIRGLLFPTDQPEEKQ